MSKKFVVRINNLQEKEPEDNYDHHTVTIVHWHRVIGAGAALLVILVLLVWLLISAMTSPPEEALTNESALPPVADVFKSNDNTVDDESASLPPDENEPTPFVLAPLERTSIQPEQIDNERDVAEESIHPDTSAVASAEQFVGEEIISVVAEEIPDFVARSEVADGRDKDQEIDQADSQLTLNDADTQFDAGTAVPPADTAELTQIADGANAADIEGPADTRPESLEEQQDLASIEGLSAGRVASILDKYGLQSSGSVENVIIHSPAISKAQLTSWVERNQPLDRLGSVIYRANDELLRVFLFTEMSGLAGRTLYHRWYLDEQEMAEVTVGVRGNEVSASSSKYIDKHMHGNWTVRVEDDLGNLLVVAEFEVRAG